MGKQITVIASESDELTFLDFLREQGPIQLLENEAKKETELWVESFMPYDKFHTQYFIWNKKYSWKPKIVHGDPEFRNGDKWCYIDLPTYGPVIEFSRTDMMKFREEGPGIGGFSLGRIYWARHNSQKGFEKWYDSIVRWIRRRAVNLSDTSWGRWCLPDAHALWLSRKAVQEK